MCAIYAQYLVRGYCDRSVNFDVRCIALSMNRNDYCLIPFVVESEVINSRIIIFLRVVANAILAFLTENLPTKSPLELNPFLNVVHSKDLQILDALYMMESTNLY